MVSQLLLNSLICSMLIERQRIVLQESLAHILHYGCEFAPLFQRCKSILRSHSTHRLLAALQSRVTIRTLVLLNLKAYKNRNSGSALHRLTARCHDAHHSAPLVCWKVNIVRDLLVVLNELFSDNSLLFVLRLTRLQHPRYRSNFLKKVGFSVKVILLNLGHFTQDQLHQDF